MLNRILLYITDCVSWYYRLILSCSAGECESWLVTEAGWLCEVMASSLFHHERRLPVLLQLWWWLHQWKATTWLHLPARQPRCRGPIHSWWCWEIPVWNSARFVCTVFLHSVWTRAGWVSDRALFTVFTHFLLSTTTHFTSIIQYIGQTALAGTSS